VVSSVGKPAIGTRAITTTGRRVIVVSYPVKEHNQDKVKVFKGKEYGCNSILMVKPVNLRIPTGHELEDPEFERLEKEWEKLDEQNQT